jgi:protein phosphatase
MKFEAAARTDVGLKRMGNEDSYLLTPEQGLFAVCDGMGGYLAGEVASKLACEEIRQFFETAPADDDTTWPFKKQEGLSTEANRLVVAAKVANQAVHQRSVSDPDCRGMGTTFVGLLMGAADRAVVAHAGDSRAYVFRGGALQRLTQDHSLVEELARLGRITEEQARNSPARNVILRALGQQPLVDIEVHEHEAKPGDVFMLCSDGLCGMIEEPEMEEALQANAGDLEKAAEALIERANAAGGLDNITVVLVRAAKPD